MWMPIGARLLDKSAVSKLGKNADDSTRTPLKLGGLPPDGALCGYTASYEPPPKDGEAPTSYR